MKKRILWAVLPTYRRNQRSLDAYLEIPENRERVHQFARNVAQLGYSIGPRR